MKLLRNKLFLIGLVCTAPFVLGTMAYLFDWGTGAGANYGDLIPPRALAASALQPLRGRWVLVSFDAPACDAHCEKKLYFMRQVRRAQGQNMERVERLWVLTGAGEPRPELLAAIEGTRILKNQDVKSFEAHAVDHVYLVDPLGNLMMRFPRDPDPGRMIKDLQRLLKYARSG